MFENFMWEIENGNNYRDEILLFTLFYLIEARRML